MSDASLFKTNTCHINKLTTNCKDNHRLCDVLKILHKLIQFAARIRQTSVAFIVHLKVCGGVLGAASQLRDRVRGDDHLTVGVHRTEVFYHRLIGVGLLLRHLDITHLVNNRRKLRENDLLRHAPEARIEDVEKLSLHVRANPEYFQTTPHIETTQAVAVDVGSLPRPLLWVEEVKDGPEGVRLVRERCT